MKICTKCKNKLDYSLFTKDKQKKDGYRPSCKNCASKLISREEADIPDLLYEIWVDINGYKGLYKISNKGRVKSIGREILHPLAILNKTKWEKTKILTPFKCGKKGFQYLRVRLYSDNSNRDFSIHILVATFFVKNVFNLPDVNHIDLDKFNNNDWNLEWVTKRENSTHRSNHLIKTSKYTGVSWNKAANMWVSQIIVNGIYEQLGYFKVEEDASNAYTNRLKDISDINRYALTP